jgi:hypothetical protein
VPEELAFYQRCSNLAFNFRNIKFARMRQPRRAPARHVPTVRPFHLDGSGVDQFAACRP